MPPKPVPPLPAEPLPTPSLEDAHLRLTYTYTPNETQVLSLEPYKSLILPYWRFVSPELAHPSASTLYQIFESYVQRGDFVGADMTRKFIQMGMTRAKRYANHKGGRKYDRTSLEKGELARERKDKKVLKKWDPVEGGEEWEKRREKEEVSAIFRRYWERCKAHDGYNALRRQWEAEKKDWQAKGCPTIGKEVAKATEVGPEVVQLDRPQQGNRRSHRIRGR